MLTQTRIIKANNRDLSISVCAKLSPSRSVIILPIYAIITVKNICILFDKKIKENTFTLSNDDIQYLYGDVQECLISLREMNILVKE